MDRRFIETIKVIDGEFCDPDRHKDRIWRTSQHFFDTPTHIDFEALPIPDELTQGIVKCRIVYGTGLQEVTFTPYSIRPVTTVACVACDTIDYRYKYADRRALNSLFEQRGDADDILIIKNGLVSDTFIGNVVFKSPQGLYTPSVPLLRGMKRALLLSEKKISERDITVEDLNLYEGFYIINTMIDIEDGVFIESRNLFY